MGSIYVGVLASKVFGESYLGLVSGVLTFFIIMFSEIIPKIYGERHCAKIALFVAPIIIFLTKIFKPINFILDKITDFFIPGKSSIEVSEGEIREMAKLGEKEGVINNYESEVINNVFKMNDITVYDIMTPKNKVIGFAKDANYNELIEKAQETGFTRFPIFRDSEIVGLVNIKDLFRFINCSQKFKISRIIRPIVFAPESMKIFTLEEKFKKARIHMAVVVNEHGNFTGIITLEDILEELLGEIEDEFDISKKDELIEKISNKKYIVNGSCEVDFLNERFNLKIPTDKNYSTLNGFLIDEMNKIPKVNDRFEFDESKFRMVNTTKRKILKIELSLSKNNLVK